MCVCKYLRECVLESVCVCVWMDMVSNKYLTTTVYNTVNTDLYTLVPTLVKYKSMCRYKETKIEKNTKTSQIKTALSIKLGKKTGTWEGGTTKRCIKNETMTYSRMQQNKQKLSNFMNKNNYNLKNRV